MEVAGLVVGIVPLVSKAKELYDLTQCLRLNPQRTKDLTELMDKLVKVLESASESSVAADALVRSSLQEVSATLESLKPEARKICCLPKFVAGYFAASGEADKLDEVERKLESLATQVVVVEGIFRLEKELKGVYKGQMHLPECGIGLERAENVLNFLRRSVGNKFRVVGIHGLPGLGKSTLLNYIWNMASSTAPFASQALVQIGQSINDSQICNLQSTILQQLGGKRNLQFTALDGGKHMLRVHLQQLKHDKKPIFLAIDNVFEAEDLRKLLPDTLANDIPASSVIAVTSRRFTVCEEILRICHLSRDNVSQVHLLNPALLTLAESKTVFAAYGELSFDGNAELLESLVPLCGGLPLALTVLGRLFAGNVRRSREEWERIKDQMEKLNGDNTETGPITKALQVSYDQFPESRKVAFCELVQCFYGWNWERVERILEVNVLNDLRESSLISEADHWSKCNQSALREGFDMDWHRPIGGTRVVTMHDVVFKFGEGLSTKLFVETTTNSREMGDLEAPKLRDLIVRRDYNTVGPLELLTGAGLLKIDQYLEKAANLQTLFLWASKGARHRNSLRATYSNDLFMKRRQPLRFLRLQGWKTSSIIMEMKLSSEIREIHLIDCDDVEQLPERTSLDALEVLSICGCKNFHSFSPSSVGKWLKLKILRVENCRRLTRVPNEMGCLEKLCDLHIDKCSCLETLPTMSCPLRRLHLSASPITHLDLEETASLTELDIISCKRLKRLPPTVAEASSLQTLKLSGCESLATLPAELEMLAALTELDVRFCRSLKVLPPAIGNLSSLRMLSLNGCEELVELPDEVGKLAALTDLHLDGCKRLKRLPSAIGNAQSIQTLSLGGCESLIELPDEVGKLKALTKLDLCDCHNLKQLPQGIGNAWSLRMLNLNSCVNLVKLPEEIGNLHALMELNLEGCESLEELPSAIGRISSLRMLSLYGCKSLIELPDEVSQMAVYINFRI